MLLTKIKIKSKALQKEIELQFKISNKNLMKIYWYAEFAFKIERIFYNWSKNKVIKFNG
jgi:hypothetical protein